MLWVEFPWQTWFLDFSNRLIPFIGFIFVSGDYGFCYPICGMFSRHEIFVLTDRYLISIMVIFTGLI